MAKSAELSDSPKVILLWFSWVALMGGGHPTACPVFAEYRTKLH